MMNAETGEPTLTAGVERRAALLIVVETVIVIFAALPGGLVFLAGAKAWQTVLYGLGVGLGLASLGSCVLVFWPNTEGPRQARLLFYALTLLFCALLVAAVWVFASVAAYGNEWID
jgi:hypothetical protein